MKEINIYNTGSLSSKITRMSSLILLFIFLFWLGPLRLVTTADSVKHFAEKTGCYSEFVAVACKPNPIAMMMTYRWCIGNFHIPLSEIMIKNYNRVYK